MAQVILSTVGTYLGGPVGGFIGAQLGSAIDKTIVNSLAPTRTVGARLSGVRLNASAQGEPVKQVFGRARVPDEITRADMSADEIGLTRLWRAGAIGFGGAAVGAVDITATWAGVSLRPRAPVHGRVRTSGGDRLITWHRCARFGGDGWEGEPPLCEEVEAYRLRFYQGDDVRRDIEVAAESFTYPAAWRDIDYPGGFDADSRLDIAQKSQIYGWGLPLKLTL